MNGKTLPIHTIIAHIEEAFARRAGRIRLNAGRKRPHWPKPRGIKQTALQFHPFLTPSVLPVDADLTTSLAFGIPSTHEAIGFDKGGDDSQALAAAVGPVQRLAVIRQKIGAGFPAVIAKRIGWTQRVQFNVCWDSHNMVWQRRRRHVRYLTATPPMI